MNRPQQSIQNSCPRTIRGLLADTNGSTIVEAAIALPVMIMLLLGAISYGIWFMAAHSVQQAANEGARAALAAIDNAERIAIVNEVVETGVLASGTVNPDGVSVQTTRSGNLFVVRVSYNMNEDLLLATSMIPLPEGPIVRSASVRLSSI